MKPTRPRTPRCRQQSGFSIIEAMVAILITLFMATALMFIFIGMRNSYNSQNQLVVLQDSERVVQTMFAAVVQQAGYYVSPQTDTAAVALPAAALTWPNGQPGSFAAGQPITGIGTGTGNGAASDAFSVRYQTANGDGVLNCNGTSNTSGANTVFINTFGVSAANELTCAVNSGAAIALANNIYSLSVGYGTDTTGRGSVDSYLNAAAVTKAGLWNNVYTVMLSITFIDPTKSTATKTVAMARPVVQVVSLQGKQ